MPVACVVVPQAPKAPAWTGIRVSGSIGCAGAGGLEKFFALWAGSGRFASAPAIAVVRAPGQLSAGAGPAGQGVVRPASRPWQARAPI